MIDISLFITHAVEAPCDLPYWENISQPVNHICHTRIIIWQRIIISDLAHYKRILSSNLVNLFIKGGHRTCEFPILMQDQRSNPYLWWSREAFEEIANFEHKIFKIGQNMHQWELIENLFAKIRYMLRIWIWRTTLQPALIH